MLRERITEGVSVTQAAADLHISRVSLSKILNGKAGISAEMIETVSGMGRTPFWLLLPIK